MPTYEYHCPEGHEFEKIQKISEKPRTKCPVCGAIAIRKISGGAGLVFKGSGFYITDYGKDGKGARKPEAGEKSEKSEKSEAPAAKTDQPASSAESKPAAEKPAAKKAKE